MPMTSPQSTSWWRTAVIYQVYPRSFADSTGNGIGDLPGITLHLDHLAALGVDAVWLSPFYTSPQNDAGYDVSDYCDVDPLFGTLADADSLVARAHGLGLRVIFDVVPNHSCAVQIRIEDALGHCERARIAGAKILTEPKDHNYGERQYNAEDFHGHRWDFTETLADVQPESWGGTPVNL